MTIKMMGVAVSV